MSSKGAGRGGPWRTVTGCVARTHHANDIVRRVGDGRIVLRALEPPQEEWIAHRGQRHAPNVCRHLEKVVEAVPKPWRLARARHLAWGVACKPERVLGEERRRSISRPPARRCRCGVVDGWQRGCAIAANQGSCGVSGRATTLLAAVSALLRCSTAMASPSLLLRHEALSLLLDHGRALKPHRLKMLRRRQPRGDGLD